ncbi:MAG: flavocytochrome c [Thermodesulfovibrionales bacterium]
MNRRLVCVIVAFLCVIFSSAYVFSAEPTRSGVSPTLADMHKMKGMDCAACHVEKDKKIKIDDNETVLNKQCVSCHGNLSALSKKAKGYINPHKSHLGDINCTACHHGHVASSTYCLSCHNFDVKIPAGVVSAPIPPIKMPEIQKIPKGIRVEKTDIVIVGSGAAGLTAAITAHDKGAKVIVLEKMPITGGNSQLAAGGMNAAGTRIQKEKGINDSPELMFEDTMKGGKGQNDPALVKILAYNSAQSVEWLSGLGADLSDVGRLGGASLNRSHRPKGGAAVGEHITHVLKENSNKRNIDIRINSRVVKILQDKKGRVTGVLVEGKYSKLYRIDAKAVVLAAGGFSANPDMVAYYQPAFKGMTTSNQPGATGDGMDLGEKAGANLVDMKEIQIHPTVAVGSRILITEAVRGNGAVLINREGNRFVNEITTRDACSAAILKQKGKTAFLVFDEGIRKSLKQIEGYFHLNLVVEGNTLKELADRLNIPSENLEKTIATYNKAVEEKKDEEFKRPDMPRAIKTAKFYSIEVMPGIHYTMGGVKIDTQTRVIDKKGKPILGLYAAGEVTGGLHGANRLGGNSISETITFGRIAGEQSAQFIKMKSQEVK